jgi:putative Holliday junction resolvase
VSQVLGFDFGMKYIGIASGQYVTNTATPLKSIKANDGIPNWDEIDSLVEEWRPQDIIVGLPLNMDGTEQLMTKRARKFGNRLSNRYKNIKVHFADERLSSWEAKEHSDPKLDFNELNAKAAAIILQQWLTSRE